jgi:predicted PurR-regulated permease PerM
MDNPKFNKSIPLLRACLWFLLAAIIIGFLIYFKGILIPFIYAIFTAFLVYELVALLGRIKIAGRALPVWFRSILVLLIVISAGIVIVEVIAANVNQIMAKAPEYITTFDNLLAQIGDLTGAEDISKEIQGQINPQDLNAMASGLLNSFSTILANLFMILLYTIFMLAERGTIAVKLNAMIPGADDREDVMSILERTGDAVQQYLSVKTLISFLTGVLGYIILVLFGVDFPVLWAFLIFLLNFIPYLGAFIATLLPAALAIFQFESLLMGFFVFLTIQAVQTLMGSIVEPRLSGKTLNLSPTIVLFSLAFWGTLWGIVGLAIAIPLTSVLVITMSEFPSTRNAAIFLSENGDIEED